MSSVSISSANPLAPAWLDVPSDANALNPAIWPTGASRGTSGAVDFAGVPVEDLARQYGTPLYLVDEDQARTRAAETIATFQREFGRVGAEAKVYYAGKAFLSSDVVRWMLEAGLGIDVASGGELAVAIAAGAPAQRIGFHGNNKSEAEIDQAVSLGVGTIILDSAIEVRRVADAARRHGVTQRVRLRVTTGVHAHTHEYLATAREDQKFGIALADADALVSAIRAEPDLEFLGLHSHIGSQIFGADGFVEAAIRLLRVHAQLPGGPAPELNLGGGFGIAYTEADTPDPLDDLVAALADAISAECAALQIPVPTIAVEPGRSIIGPAGITLYTAGTVKDVSVTAEGGTAIRRYVSVDGGMSDNARPALYEADYTVRVLSRSSDAPAELVRVAGKHCESGDIVVQADYLPADVQPGDLLGVAATGAYCFSLSSNYNYLARPAVVAVSKGASRVLVRGETITDLLARDAGLS